MSKYKPKRGSRFSQQDVDVFAPEIEKISERSGGASAELIVKEAENNNNLRPFFEWDDKKAGHQYRVVQAREMARSVVIVVENEETKEEEEVRAFYAVRVMMEEGQKEAEPAKRYVSFESVQENPDYVAQIRADAGRELGQFREKYSQYLRIFEIEEEIGRALDRLKA